MATLVVCSGGLDSVTLAHRVAEAGDLAGLVTFDYGQRHRKELDFAAAAAQRLGAAHDVVDLSVLGRHLAGSALTDDVDVPDGHYAADNMAVTVVPNRNPILFTIAFGIASARGWDGVAAAIHTGDHFVYPDCRPEFVTAFAEMEHRALEGMGEVAFHTPFVGWSKADIVAEGARLGVPFAETWSCYRGEGQHCGRCGTCVERREAFHVAGVTDPTAYADPDYWQQALSEHA
jgi:7-cyano-7-deazaguanine synthase